METFISWPSTSLYQHMMEAVAGTQLKGQQGTQQGTQLKGQ